MKKLKKFMISTVFVILGGCTYSNNEIQYIDLQYFQEFEKNLRLIKSLMRYHPEYITENIKTIKDEDFDAVHINYTVNESAGSVGCKVKYDLAKFRSYSNFGEVKKEMELFIEEMAKSNADKDDIYQALSTKGIEWINLLHDEKSNDISHIFSTKFIDKVGKDGIKKMKEDITSSYGPPQKIVFNFAQYYKPFKINPESIVLYYVVNYKSNKKVEYSLQLEKVNLNWKMYGFVVRPFAS